MVVYMASDTPCLATQVSSVFVTGPELHMLAMGPLSVIPNSWERFTNQGFLL